MRLPLVLLALAPALLVLPVAAPAAAIGIPILDNLYNWPSECGEQRHWFGTTYWEKYCEGGVGFFAPNPFGSSTDPEWDGCFTCRVLP